MASESDVEISAELRDDRAASWAVWQGDMQEDPRNPGEKREKWIFLPKSCCAWDGKNTWTVPYNLAREKGLI